MRSGCRTAYSMHAAPPCERPSSGKRSRSEAATIASRSATCASCERSCAFQSDNPQPRGSKRISWRPAERKRNQWRHTGLCQSNSRCDSQFADLTSGAPLPEVATARRTPSTDLMNRIVCCIGDTALRWRGSGAAAAKNTTPTGSDGAQCCRDRQSCSPHCREQAADQADRAGPDDAGGDERRADAQLEDQMAGGGAAAGSAHLMAVEEQPGDGRTDGATNESEQQ